MVFIYRKLLNISIWPIDGTQTGITTPDQSGPESNDNEGVLHTPQSYRTGSSPSDGLMSYQGHSVMALIPLQRCNRRILLLLLGCRKYRI